jgi:3-(3-hydroxy-phenyl)propionate hydroxylase
VPELDWVVETVTETDAAFVVGADGQNSFVRRHGKFQDEELGRPMCFEVFEFQLDRPLEAEARVVFDGTTTSVLWPLGQTNARWSFQIPAHGDDFPEKDRSYEITERPSPSEPAFARLQALIQQRAPWFDRQINEMHWHTEVEFHQRLAKPFYQGRCVLAGDAAHQTSPIGVQSMNSGMSEAAELGETLKRVLRDHAPLESLETFDKRRRHEWAVLLGLHDEIRATASTPSWVREQRLRILASLPSEKADLDALVRQVGLESQGEEGS